jgi:hypothetical protein
VYVSGHAAFHSQPLGHHLEKADHMLTRFTEDDAHSDAVNADARVAMHMPDQQVSVESHHFNASGVLMAGRGS